MKQKVLKIFIPAVLIVGCIGIFYFFNTGSLLTENQPVIVCEDVSQLNLSDDKPLQIVQRKKTESIDGLHDIRGFINHEEILVGVGLSKDEFLNKYKGKEKNNMSYTESDEMYNDLYGKLYKMNLKTLEKTPLKKDGELLDNRKIGAGLSLDGRYLDFDKLDGKQILYDLENETYKAYDQPMIGQWSRDYQYIVNFNHNKWDNILRVYDVKNDKTKQVKIDKDIVEISVAPGFYTEDGKDIYFIGKQSKGSKSRQGIFKINSDTQQVETVLVLPYINETEDRNYSGIPDRNYTLLDGGKKILLNATLNDVDATYIYDTEKDEFYKVVSHVEEGYCSSFWVSPDKTKVVYRNQVKVDGGLQWNLYAAKIIGNNFINRICIAKNIDLGGSRDHFIHWSSDSKGIIFFETKTISEKGFTLSDENIINSITFK